MKIQIQSISMKNFKGVINMDINFSEYTEISGANATGKSTIVDAFTWLLFGKDAQDRKDFEIKTLDSKGVVIPRIDHEVTGILMIDGVMVTLKRILREKWVKKQGTAETVFTGNETLYFVNDVPKSQKEYQDYIDQVIPEATFKLLTNPTYFNSIKWQDRRALLTSIANVPDDETIAGNDLANVLKIMRDEKKTLSDLKKEYAAKKTKIKAAIEQIPARLDEVHRSTPEEKDFDFIEKEIATLKTRIATIDGQILDKSKGVQEQVQVRSNALRLKNELEMAISNIKLDAMKEFGRNAGAKDNEINTLEQSIQYKKENIEGLESQVKMYEGQIANLTKINDSLRKTYAEINSAPFNEESIIDTCPTCNQKLPDNDISEQRKQLVNNFNNAKAEKIAEINKTGVANKNAIDHAKGKIQSLEGQIANLKAEIVSISEKIEQIKSTPSELKSVEYMVANNPDYQKFSAQLEKIVIPEVKEVDTSDLYMEKSELSVHLETLQAAMLQRAVIASMNARKETLLKEETALNQELAEMEGFEFQITEFTNRKMKAVEDSVNTMFPTVRFKMFDIQINGGIAETCETLINGVPFGNCNNAGRINTGVEIISVFSKINDIYAPIFIDNAESLNSIYPVENQLIALYVSTDKELKIVSESLAVVA